MGKIFKLLPLVAVGLAVYQTTKKQYNDIATGKRVIHDF